MGMMPDRLQRPTVGLMPTIPLIDDGHMIEPPVSVPMVSAARFAEGGTPEPELGGGGGGARARGGARRSRHLVVGVDVVFDGDRDSVQRTAETFGAALGVERVRDRERLGVGLDDGPQRGPPAVGGGAAGERA